jgi:hypothetical protein
MKENEKRITGWYSKNNSFKRPDYIKNPTIQNKDLNAFENLKISHHNSCLFCIVQNMKACGTI